MKGFLLIAGVALLTLLGSGQAAMAQSEEAKSEVAIAEAETPEGGFWFFPPGRAGKAIGVALGIGVIVFGAAKGIGRIGGSAVESIARQPEAGGQIFTAMLLAAALIEGFTLFALLIQFTL